MRRMLDLAGSPDPCSRESYAPGHFTASAFVLSPERDALLLVFHKKLRIWVQPGGHIDGTDETFEAAARREVEEEVGLGDLVSASPGGTVFDVDIHPIPERPGEPRHEHFDVRFLFVAKSKIVRESDETEGVRWVSLSEVPGFATDESVRRAVRKVT